MKAKLVKKCIGPTATFKIFELNIKGKKFKKNVVEFPRTVGILPIISENKIVLVKQYRFALNKHLWEIPAGKLSKNEKPEIGAERELKEETGFETRRLEKIGEFYLSPGYSKECMSLFKATSLKKGKQNLNEDELINKVKIFTQKEVLKMIKEKKIVDAKTIIAILLWKLEGSKK